MELSSQNAGAGSVTSQTQSVRISIDDDDDDDASALQQTMQREWNTADFTGKYHLSKFANQATSLPGTQVRVEKDYLDQKAARAKQWEDESIARTKRMNEKLRIKSESAELNTKIYFDTILGQNIKDAEAILNEREAILHHTEVIADSRRDIDRFLKNVKLNRHHYVGFAASSGYKSINYADPVFGNSALHLSVKMGHVSTTEELLKYSADMDCINRLGNRPIHECWAFWDNDKFRSAETRLAQEHTTCQLLLTLLQYGTCVDSVDQNKESVLHIACRKGPTKAVKIILTFKANLLLKNSRGQTAMDVAAASGNEESLKLLLCWGHISHQLVQLDFHAIWHKFLTDYSQVISTHKSAAAILAEIEISSSIRHMKQSNNSAVQIDDPLLQSAFELSKQSTHTPKPWDGAAWAAFVKQKQAEGTVDIRTQLENLTLQLKGMKVRNTGQIRAQKALQMTSKHKISDSPDKVAPPPRERLLVDTVTKSYVNSSISRSISTAMSPKFAKVDKHLRGIDISGNAATPTHSGSTAADGAARIVVRPVYKAIALDATIGNFADRGKDGTQGTVAEHQGEQNGNEEEEEEGEEESRDVYAVRRTDYGEIADFKASDLGSRRLKLAQKVCLDAKFLSYTKRLSTHSVLLLPLRTPQAPLKGTEEEHDRLRAIASQGPDFDKFEKYKARNTYNDRVGLHPDPKKNVLGAYVDHSVVNTMTERDILYEQLIEIKAEEKGRMLDTIASNNASRAQSRAGGSRPGTKGANAGGGLSRQGTADTANLSRAGTAATLSRTGTANTAASLGSVNTMSLGYASRKVVLDVEKREKIDLVQDRRPRYVDPELLPSVKVLSLVEKMSQDDAVKQKMELRRRQGLGNQHSISAAREQMEADIGAPSSLGADDSGAAGALDNSLDSITGLDTNARNRKLAAEKQVALKKLFLQKEEVHYGEGRITSTHNAKGKIEEPWTVVKGRYTVLEGDRTG